MSEQYKQLIEEIRLGLKKFQGYYLEEYYWELEDQALRIEEKIRESLDEGRRLRIGIVGEVKAGKSSFLNALLFNGRDILPKASTPMTAALTKVVHAEKPSAKIVFYSEGDWRVVKRKAEEYQEQLEKLYQEYLKSNTISSKIGFKKTKSREEMKRILEKKIAFSLVSCNELAEMAERSAIDITCYLGKEKELAAGELQSDLENYIGANGAYTAIVKHVELRIPDMPEEIEIVDTPGLNDPILSRSETTKKFLGMCDVVFLLSYCGQFLSQEDLSFMCETLPREGIRNVILVGSKFDSGLLDENKVTNLKAAYHKVKAIYDRQAEENIDRCISSNCESEVLQSLKQSLPPSYISSLFYSCAVKQEENRSYSEAEEMILRRLKEHFSDFQADSPLLFALSGIKRIKKEKLRPIMKEKEKIIQERNQEMILNHKKVLLKILENIYNCAVENRRSMEHENKNNLEEKLRQMQLKLNSIQTEIQNIFISSAIEAEKFLNKMEVTIEEEIDNYTEFQVEENVRTEDRSYRTGFLWLRKEYRLATITSYTANPSDVIRNLRQYIVACKKHCNEEFEKVINVDILEKKVKEATMGAFDLSRDDFREIEILGPLDIAVKKIQIPKIPVEVDQYDSFITEKFSETVIGNQISELQLLENRVLHMISKEIRQELAECQRKIEEVMKEQAANFVNTIKGNIQKNIENLQKQLENKENSIKQYDTLCNMLVQYQRKIKAMEI